MTCESVRSSLPAYVGGDLRPASMDLVREHLTGCRACEAALAPLRTAHRGLAALAVHEVDPPEGLVDDVLSAVHERRPLVARLVPIPPIVTGDVARVIAENRDALASAAGTAAGVAAAAGIGWALWRSATRRRPATGQVLP